VHQAQVENLEFTVSPKDQVGRLDVTMDDAPLRGVLEATSGLTDQRTGIGDWQGP
jgi:hypothetical protein